MQVIRPFSSRHDTLSWHTPVCDVLHILQERNKLELPTNGNKIPAFNTHTAPNALLYVQYDQHAPAASTLTPIALPPLPTHTGKDTQRPYMVRGPHTCSTICTCARKVVAQRTGSHIPNRQHVPSKGCQAHAHFAACMSWFSWNHACVMFIQNIQQIVVIYGEYLLFWLILCICWLQ
jgi:hypothetical protein